MKYLFRFILIVILLLGGLPIRAEASGWQAKVDPWVLATSAQGDTEFLISLTEQADVSGAARLPTKLEKGTYVLKQLNEVAQRTQPAVIAVLKKYGAEYRAFRVANLIWARGSQEAIRALAERSDVARLYANPKVQLAIPAEPAFNLAGSQPDQSAAPEAIEWNITKVNAPQVWAAGFTGQGAVIAGQDTGYEWDHPALKNQYRGWNGTSADHNYNWHDAIHYGSAPCGADSPEPCDEYGHGTHTMGTMVGDVGGTHKIGMAPGAKWIGCRNMDNNGVGSPDTYAECFEWFLAPYPIGGDPSQGDPSKAPDVISNSWTCPPNEGCSYDTLNAIVNIVRAAGIVVVAAAGNSGYNGCSTVSDPPAIYNASFTVGATDSGDIIAGFSSRGPVIVDGSNRSKPDISAPGQSVRSCVPGGGYSNMSGTSMATPHVAGLVGLLISAQPALRGQVDEIETLIERTAVERIDLTCGGDPSGIPNNTYGWGRIDALAAYQEIPHYLILNKTASAEIILKGETLTYTLTITHSHPFSPTTNVVLTDTIPVGVVFQDATQPFSQTGDVIEWNFPSLGVGASASVTMTVGVPLTLTGTITNANYGVKSDDVSTVTGSPVETVITYPPTLTKTAPERVAPGDLLTYHLTVANLNPYAAVHNLVLTDTLPANTSFVAATQPYTMSTLVVTWQLPVLAAASQWGVTLTVQSPFTFTGTISNTAYGFSSDEFEPLAGYPVRTDIFGLMVEKSAAAEVMPGDLLTYTLTVTNLHPTEDTYHLILSDTLPAGVQFVSATAGYTLSGDQISWSLEHLAAASVWQVQITVRVGPNAAGIITNDDYQVHSDEVNVPVTGSPVNSLVWRKLWLPFLLLTP